jgi:hypothetical protein
MRSRKWRYAMCFLLLMLPIVAAADAGAGSELLDRLKTGGMC